VPAARLVAGRALLEVLGDFPSAAPPLAWLLQAGPRLQPRRFSIASSARAHPDEARRRSTDTTAVFQAAHTQESCWPRASAAALLRVALQIQLAVAGG